MTDVNDDRVALDRKAEDRKAVSVKPAPGGTTDVIPGLKDAITVGAAPIAMQTGIARAFLCRTSM